MSKLRHGISVRLSGGLANQLFQVSFGEFLSKKLNTSVRYYRNSTSNSRFFRNPSLDFLQRSGIQVETKAKSLASSYLDRIFEYALRQSPFWQKILKVHVPSEVGYSIGHSDALKFVDYRGHYQSYIYANELVPKINFDGLQTSHWFDEMRATLERGSNTVAIHIRRGDYTSLANYYGLLSAEYYVQALNEIKKTFEPNNIYIFSDDPGAARKLLSNSIKRAIFVEAPQESAAIESMQLMGLCDALVLANSTYSWWAAAISPRKQLVVSPEPWLLGNDTPRELIPTEWLKIAANWEKEDADSMP